MSGISAMLVKIGRSVGGVVGTLYQAGRDSVDTVIRNVIPFMAIIPLLIGLASRRTLYLCGCTDKAIKGRKW